MVIKKEEKFKGNKITITSFTKMLNKKVVDFDTYIEKELFVNKEGFVTNNKYTKYVENETTLIL